jgi:hypothetical protein
MGWFPHLHPLGFRVSRVLDGFGWICMVMIIVYHCSAGNLVQHIRISTHSESTKTVELRSDSGKLPGRPQIQRQRPSQSETCLPAHCWSQHNEHQWTLCHKKPEWLSWSFMIFTPGAMSWLRQSWVLDIGVTSFPTCINWHDPQTWSWGRCHGAYPQRIQRTLGRFSTAASMASLKFCFAETNWQQRHHREPALQTCPHPQWPLSTLEEQEHQWILAMTFHDIVQDHLMSSDASYGRLSITSLCSQPGCHSQKR